MVWIGTYLKDHLIPTPRHRQEHLPLNQVAQNPTRSLTVEEIFILG